MTKNYLCFTLVVSGSIEVWPYDDDVYSSGVILAAKSNPKMVSLFNFPSEDIVSIQETLDKKMKIVTTKLKIVYSIIDGLANKISNHFPIGYYRSFGEYYEYLYDSTLIQISRNKVQSTE